MNRDKEAFENLEGFDGLECLFLELLQGNSRNICTPESLAMPPEARVISSDSAKFSCEDQTLSVVDNVDPLDSEDVQFLPISEMGLCCRYSDASGHRVSDVEQLHTSGDTPVIEDRSQTILKSRLRTEIEHHPPLFPWETEIVDYEPETIDFSQVQLVPSLLMDRYGSAGIDFWTPQLPNINGLMSLPQEVLGKLLEQCSQAIKSNLREWAKLVDVVEKTLFPGRFQELNEIASSLSLAQAIGRDPIATELPMSEKAGDLDSPVTYEVATPTQQMLMSLLAAQEIIGNLTLELSSSEPYLERQWLTAAGSLSLEIEYYPAPAKVASAIKVGASLPCGGSVSLAGGPSQAQSERSNPGKLTVELSDRHLQENYLLEVRLHSSEQNPLTFAVCVRR